MRRILEKLPNLAGYHLSTLAIIGSIALAGCNGGCSKQADTPSGTISTGPATRELASASADAVHYVSSDSSSKATVSGTSTVHDWSVKSSAIDGKMVSSGWKAGSTPTI